MGDKWVTVRKAAHDGTLRANMPEAREVAERWEEFTQYLCLGLSQDLGRMVTAPRPRAATTAGILDGHLKRLADTGAWRPCCACRTPSVTSGCSRICVPSER